MRPDFLSFGNKGILAITDGMYGMLFTGIYLPHLSDLKLCIACLFCESEGLLKGSRVKRS